MRSWHTTCILVQQLKNIGFPGWPERNLDFVLVLGGQLTKGACTGPLFLFLPAQSLHQLRKSPLHDSSGLDSPCSFDDVSRFPWTRKKLSRRWGHWRLGRGMEGNYAEVQHRSRLATALAGTVSETAPSRITIMQRIKPVITIDPSALQAHSVASATPVYIRKHAVLRFRGH